MPRQIDLDEIVSVKLTGLQVLKLITAIEFLQMTRRLSPVETSYFIEVLREVDDAVKSAVLTSDKG